MAKHATSVQKEEEIKRQDVQMHKFNNELGSLKDQIEKFQKSMDILRQRPSVEPITMLSRKSDTRSD